MYLKRSQRSVLVLKRQWIKEQPIHHHGAFAIWVSCLVWSHVSITHQSAYSFGLFFPPLDHVSEAFQPCLLQPGNGHIVYLHLALSLDACVASRFISEAEAKICFLSGYNENNMDSYISNTQQSWRRGNSHTVTLFPPRFPTYPLLEDSFCFWKINYLFMSWNFGKI